MVYILLAFGAVFLLFWGLTLIFAIRSTGERSIPIPIFFLLIFLSVFAFGASKWQLAQDNPELLVKETFVKIKFGDSVESLRTTFGSPDDLTIMSSDELKKYDLTTNMINIPLDVRSRMKPGEYVASRIESGIQFSIVGDPSEIGFEKRLGKDEVHPVTLGSTAESGNGITGFKLRIFLNDSEAEDKIKEERKALIQAAKDEKADLPEFEPIVVPALDGKQWIFEEGKDFTYEENQDDETVVANISAVIEADPDFCTEFDPEDDPIRFVVKPECGCEKFNALLRASGSKYAKPAVDACKKKYSEEGNFLGVNGNDLRMQVMVEEGRALPNRAIYVGGASNGKAVSFRGGYNKTSLDYWYEIDPLLDEDFSTTPRLIVAGYISDKLVSLGENGIVFPEGEYFKIPEDNCLDNFDEDGDGNADCADSDCVEHPLCLE